MEKVKTWTDGVEFEPEAQQQVRNVAALEFVSPHVAIMPDVHWGKGATIGSVIPTRGAIIPAAVGVDIGCGMVAGRTNLTASELPDSLAAMRSNIERDVPHGRTDNGGTTDRGRWGDIPAYVNGFWLPLNPEYERIMNENPGARPRTHPSAHMGTLGGGNHFIEVCIDEEQRVWLMLHSGSRGVGNKIGTHFIERAKEAVIHEGVTLPDMDLAWLAEGTPVFDEYVLAVGWAQRFAAQNRRVMLESVRLAVVRTLGRRCEFDRGVVNCHHNYVQRETHFGEDLWITRKGAVSARLTERGIIPGSMGAKSYIVEGLGNPDSFQSCSHGAGRRMSRGRAKKEITVEQHAAAVAGVECRTDAAVIDESPAAYKDIDAVMAAQTDLVKVVHTLRQVLCVKG